MQSGALLKKEFTEFVAECKKTTGNTSVGRHFNLVTATSDNVNKAWNSIKGLIGLLESNQKEETYLKLLIEVETVIADPALKDPTFKTLLKTAYDAWKLNFKKLNSDKPGEIKDSTTKKPTELEAFYAAQLQQMNSQLAELTASKEQQLLTVKEELTAAQRVATEKNQDAAKLKDELEKLKAQRQLDVAAAQKKLDEVMKQTSELEKLNIEIKYHAEKDKSALRDKFSAEQKKLIAEKSTELAKEKDQHAQTKTSLMEQITKQQQEIEQLKRELQETRAQSKTATTNGETKKGSPEVKQDSTANGLRSLLGGHKRSSSNIETSSQTSRASKSDDPIAKLEKLKACMTPMRHAVCKKLYEDITAQIDDANSEARKILLAKILLVSCLELPLEQFIPGKTIEVRERKATRTLLKELENDNKVGPIVKVYHFEDMDDKSLGSKPFPSFDRRIHINNILYNGYLGIGVSIGREKYNEATNPQKPISSTSQVPRAKPPVPQFS